MDKYQKQIGYLIEINEGDEGFTTQIRESHLREIAFGKSYISAYMEKKLK